MRVLLRLTIYSLEYARNQVERDPQSSFSQLVRPEWALGECARRRISATGLEIMYFKRCPRCQGDLREGSDTFAPGHEAGLTPREVEVLELMGKGAVNKQIAGQLLIGESTVKTHIVHILGKLEVHGRTGAVMEAARRGIIRP